jgi:hypothetical protein
LTLLPERIPKKTTVPSIVALLSNGCKQAFPLLTVDLERARHNICQLQFCKNFSSLSTDKYDETEEENEVQLHRLGKIK